jgi:hypothetical protein
VGDYVSIGGIEGVVEEISLNFTKIRSKDSIITLLSNTKILDYEVINYTLKSKEYGQSISNLKIDLGILQKRLEGKKVEAIQAKIQQITQEISFKNQKMREIQQLERALEQRTWIRTTPYSKYVKKGKIVRYTFFLDLPRDLPRNTTILNSICENWQPVFEMTPRWKPMGHTHFLRCQFTIITPDPEDILKHYADFVKDIYTAIYTQTL